MQIEMVKVDRADDQAIKALADLDAKIFPHANDLFDAADWEYFRKIFEFFWIVVDGVTVGSIHMGPNLHWEEEFPTERKGCLYAAGLGILPEFRGRGIGTRVKRWQIGYAAIGGFDVIVANCRLSNQAMIRLNRNLGYQVVDMISDFWNEPVEDAIVLEFRIMVSTL